MNDCSSPVHRKAELLAHYEAPEGYVYLVLREPEIARAALPGQFVMLRGWPARDPILPRPFDIVLTDEKEESFSLCVKLSGRGTTILGELKPGAQLFVTGPLGRGLVDFSCRGMGLLVRGVGAAAVVSLAEAAYRRKVPVFTVLSASAKDRLVCRELLERFSAEVLVATDDGSEGYKGNGTDLADRLLAEGRIDRLYTCGSRRFARHVKRLDAEGKAAGYIFLEELMACGLGDCHGCAVKKAKAEGYFLVCRDGPVFPASEVMLE